jgi:transcriptional regulator with XRE-family HTH domain
MKLNPTFAHRQRERFDRKAITWRWIRARHFFQEEYGWLRSLREAKRLSQREIAQKLGLHVSAIHRIELAEVRKSITLKQLIKVAEALDAEVGLVVVPRGSLREYMNDPIWKWEKEAIKQIKKQWREEVNGPLRFD